ncbi:helix-turn-helix domain-containing protein [Ottowia thiooxydans]|uniref:helix-turn-helix domain-containing protein n=1 Tax=Ottowia thiooxydans TaxID=219182 RepID=UPI00048E2E41|nr:helix-turn-helix domain-containing protein [Ottowia thiooxydans]
MTTTIGTMKPAPQLLVPFREVRHDEPDDCLHYESVAVRGEEMDWTIPAHRHEGLHQFQLLSRGAVTGTIDGRPFEAVGPTLIVLSPGSVHGFRYTAGAVGHQVTIPTATLRTLLGSSELVDSTLDASFVITTMDADHAAVGALFEQVAREFVESAPGRVHALLALATLIAVFALRHRRDQFERESSRGVRDTLLQRYTTLVEKHHVEHRSMDFYACTLGVTPDHLSRTCRKVGGKSALQILHDRVLLEARRLLAYTPAPVAIVASKLGYEDPAYFSRFFTREMGQTPSEYRTSITEGVKTAEPLARSAV